MNDAQQNNKLGALWEKISSRGTYMTGKIDPSKWTDDVLSEIIDRLSARQPLMIVVFRRDTSKDPADSRRPTWDILKPRAREDNMSVPRSAPVALTDSDIPF